MNRLQTGWVATTLFLTTFGFLCVSANVPDIQPAWKGGQSTITTHTYDPRVRTVIGSPTRHVVSRGDTLLDIARDFKLGFNQLEALYPHIDPWIPPQGMELLIPTQWVLPETVESGIIINSAELRLYHFLTAGAEPLVQTYPIGIGGLDWPTPTGSFTVGEMRENPTWYVPPSLREKYGFSAIPPGPKNPLGSHWIRLGQSNYGIHGTNNPWSVGRRVTHGCIRLYPEDIEHLYQTIRPGTPVTIIYEPVKIGQIEGRIYAEVHGDPYQRINDFIQYGHRRLREARVDGTVDLKRFEALLEQRPGLPVDISLPTW